MTENPLGVIHHLRVAVGNGDGLTPEETARTLRLIDKMDLEITRLARLSNSAPPATAVHPEQS